jgi:hypothetical protein
LIEANVNHRVKHRVPQRVSAVLLKTQRNSAVKKMNKVQNDEVSNLRDKAANWKQQTMNKEQKLVT